MPDRPTFIIGVWAQPTSSFAKWKSIGVNTLFGAETEGGKITKAAWEAEAAKAGLWFVTLPGDNITAEALQPYRLGFMQPDEPDMSNHVNSPGSTMPELRERYAKCKKASTLPVFMNLGGPAFDNIWYDGNPKPDKTDGSKWGHRASANGYMAQADIIGFDYHLWTSGRPGAFDITRRLMDRCHQWSGGKPFFVYVESCTQGTGKPFNADAFETQVNQAIAYAALRGYRLAGIIEFATAPNGQGGWPAAFDAAPDDVKARRPIVYARTAAAFNAQVIAAPTTTTVVDTVALDAANAQVKAWATWYATAPR